SAPDTEKDNKTKAQAPKEQAPQTSNQSQQNNPRANHPHHNKKKQSGNYPHKNQNQGNSQNQESTEKNKYRAANYEFEGIIDTEGVLEIMPDNYGFLRSSDFNYLSSPDDVY